MALPVLLAPEVALGRSQAEVPAKSHGKRHNTGVVLGIHYFPTTTTTTTVKTGYNDMSYNDILACNDIRPSPEQILLQHNDILDSYDIVRIHGPDLIFCI
jgi:hypothetical protein